MKDNPCIRVFADQRQIERGRRSIEQVAASLTGLAGTLSLAGNEVRLKILFLIHQEGELCVCDLSDILKMKISAVSQHLRKLKDGNIIQSKKVGQTIFYRLRPEQAQSQLFETLFALIHGETEATVS